MSRITQVKVGPLATASTTSIVATTTGSTTAGTAFTLTTSPFVLDTPRRILITSGSSDVAVKFTISGTDWSGLPATETLTGGATNAQSVNDYSTITSITPLNNTAGTNSVGTNGVASSRPIFLDTYGFPAASLEVTVSGTVNYTVQQSLDNPTDPNWLVATGATSSSMSFATWTNSADASVVATTSSAESNYAFAPAMTRVTVNSNTNPAYVVFKVIQSASPSI